MGLGLYLGLGEQPLKLTAAIIVMWVALSLAVLHTG